MSRRAMLAGIAAGAITGLAACAPGAAAGPPATIPAATTPAATTPAGTGTPTATAADPVTPVDVPAVPAPPAMPQRIPVPPGTLTELPSEAGNVIAWTVDDGASSAVVGAYTAFAAASGIRLTFFVNGTYSSWDDHADALRPLVEAGQVQLANHTWSHPDLTTLGDADIQSELQRNHDYLAELYGVDARPYFRPPYGRHDDRVDAAAAAIGYTVPTLWYGSLSDSGELPDQQIVDLAAQWFTAGRIVIGHLNHDPVTRVFDRLEGILRERGLTTITLNDLFITDAHP